ncbi:hypothetical protein LTR85_003933 [Meristemomyces frigidus]|nr:hypothetical protein LTR85_003933 [Meristemomyces frigidus]
MENTTPSGSSEQPRSANETAPPSLAPNIAPAGEVAAPPPSAASRLRTIIELVNSYEAATKEDVDDIYASVNDIFRSAGGQGLSDTLVRELQEALQAMRLAPGVHALHVVVQGADGVLGGGAQRHRLINAQLDTRDAARTERIRQRAESRRLLRFNRERRARICRSDHDALLEEEQAEDEVELDRMSMGQRVQLTRAARDEMRAMGLPVPGNGVVYIRGA